MLFLELMARRPGAQVPRPTNLAVTAAPGALTVSWTNANSTLETQVWRDGVLVATTAASVSSYVDNAVFGGTEYAYQLRHKASATSFSSFTVEVVQATTPPAPTIAATVFEDDVTISWAAIGSATSYRVYRGSTSNVYTFEQAGVVGTSFVDADRPNGTWYYVVRAENAVGVSALSNQVSAVVAYAPPLTPPSGFTATGTYSDLVTLNWTPGDVTAETEVYRGTSPDPTSLLTTLAAGASSYVDSLVTDNTTYYYRIRHVKNASISAYVADDVVLPDALLSDISLTADIATNEVTLTYTVVNPPALPRIDVGDWSDTNREVEVSSRTDVGSSPVTIATYANIVPIPTGTSVTGTLTYVRLRNGSGIILDSLTNLTVDFDIGIA